MKLWSAVIYYRLGSAAKRLWNALHFATMPTKKRKTRSGDESPRFKWLFAAILVLCAATARSEDKVKPPATAKTLPWLSSLAEGKRQAAANHKPLLIRVGATWCGPCRKLDAEIERPSVQAELARWTLVYLEADKAEEEASELNVSGIPALRIDTMLGESVAARDGFLSAEELVSWLKKQYEAASAEADEILLTDDEPDAAAVVRLIRQLPQRNSAIREAAIRRLAPYPQKARLGVVSAFADGNLSRRLAALELLQQWQAPIADLDPWQPQSLTKERMAALNLWAEKYQPPVSPEAKKRTEQSLVEARREIDRMLKANDRDAEAFRNRLAGYGRALLPEVTARLKETADDGQRQRLWALRYGLVAADSLPLRWPGGLQRLADADPRHRQQAADELARLATAADQPLLIELFSDSDPLVRELSLRGLQSIGGRETTSALANLLSDPEPNVRAAVLKQLEEKPDASIIPKLAEYLKTEKDADLVVHAIRFLKAAGGAPATRALIPMLRHESWQVRAEACEALGKTQTHQTTYSFVNGVAVESGDNLQVEVYVAMLDLLADGDAFVVSRAVDGLANADMAVAVDPLVRAAAKHPDLAPKIVEILAQGRAMRVAALPHLHKFRKHDNPQVRAAALAGLTTILPDEMGEELSAGLQDPSDKVRIAAAQVCFKAMEAQRLNRVQELRQGRTEIATSQVIFETAPVVQSPSLLSAVADFFTKSKEKAKPAVESRPTADTKPATERKPASGPKPAKLSEKSKPAEASPVIESRAEEPKAVDEAPYDRWLQEYYAGKRRPIWAAKLIAPLEKMLQAKSADERLAAAIALVPLGKSRTVLPAIYDVAQSDPKKYREAMEILPWLVWEQRRAAFQQLCKIAPSPDAVAALVEPMAEVRDPRAAEFLWGLLADAKTSEKASGAIQRGLLEVHGIEYWYSPRSGNQSDVSKHSLLELAKAAKAKAAGGSEKQRLVALSLLAYASPEEAFAAAEKLQADAAASAGLRNDAFQILLVSAPPKEGVPAAAAALAGKDRARQKLALHYFASGVSSLTTVRDSLNVPAGWDERVRTSGVPIVPKPPERLQVSQLVPLLDDSDPAVAAEAGYLLALLGESRGLPPLLRYAQQQGKSDSSLQRLAYRAISVLDDTSQIPTLRKIYAGLSQYEVSDFYWTIRIMTGPEILKFRKQIRDEVGMSQLQ